jgi:cytochrome c
MGGKWGFTDMDKFLLKPRNFLPGTKMSFRGIKSASDRAAIIMYLRSFAEIPLTLPK